MPTTTPSEISAIIRSAMLEAMTDFSEELANGLRDDLATPYPPASEPGNFPHLRSGTLQGSVESTVRESGAVITAEASVDTSYAGYLENGTRNDDGSVRMAPRPMAQLTAQKVESNPERIAELLAANL